MLPYKKLVIVGMPPVFMGTGDTPVTNIIAPKAGCIGIEVESQNFPESCYH